MDFWDSRTDEQKALCVRLLSDVLTALDSSGRAPVDEASGKRGGE
jgi:hypothetical protein